ncbi:TPA: hypothetical protein ACGXGE_006081 [Bacillus pacificus]
MAKEGEVGWENTEPHRNELDVDLFPTVVYESLPDPCLFQVMIFTDENLEVVDWEKIKRGK